MKKIDFSGTSLRACLFTKVDETIGSDDVMRELDAKDIVFPVQVHGHETVIVHEGNRGGLSCDALATNVSGLALCVFAADCQTFIIHAKEKHVLGVVHAGWRGMAQNILTEFYKKIYDEWGVTPTETDVYAGPSLCTQHAEFTDPQSELPIHLHPFIHEKCVDLRAAADQELFSLGVPADHIVRSPDCTACYPDKYRSVRAKNCSTERKTQPDGFAMQRAVLCACLP